jgi:type II secretory pathway pseudopilin PulG
MIVVAIIGLLAIIAMVNFYKARATAQQNACFNNMRQIDYGKQQWAFNKSKDSTAIPSEDEIGAYIRGGFPRCPTGGTYAIGDSNTAPSCTIHRSPFANP